jgi:hypothetical protein
VSEPKPYKIYPGPNMALSQTALEAMAHQLAPSSIFELHINPAQTIWTRTLLRKIGCDVEENPFAPYVNLVLDKSLGLVEWYVVDGNGLALGCEGL